MTDLYKKIENFKINNPRVSTQEIEELVQTVASECMQCIVSNEEFNGRASGAWWTIKDSFDIDVNNQEQMLPINRIASNEVQAEFSKACEEANIENIKIALKKFPNINTGSNTSALTNAIVADNLTTLKFFIDDDFINRNPLYKNQVGFQYIKGELFSLAYYYERKEILEYLIVEHNLETILDAKEVIKNDNSELKNAVIEMINKKYNSLVLDLALGNNPKPKIKHVY